MTSRKRFRRGKGRIGSSFDEFLKEEGLYEEVTSRAVKRVVLRRAASRKRKAT